MYTKEKFELVKEEFGDLHFNLDSIMKEKGIRSYQLESKTGIKSDIIRKYRNDDCDYISKTVLIRLLAYFHCTPNDLFTYTPPKKEQERLKRD